jgi:opacity protein-like surface antigen
MQVSSWPIITNSDGARTAGIGGYFGYNTQWDEIVMGLDVNYTRMNYINDAAGSMRRIATLSNDFQYDVTASVQSHVEVKDVVTARARIGYAFSQFLPYMTGGLALARASRFTTATVSYPAPTYAGTDDPPPPGLPAFAGTQTSADTNFLAYGYALGGGVDFMLMPNVIVRAEYEYVYLTNIATGLNNARVGLAVKF